MVAKIYYFLHKASVCVIFFWGGIISNHKWLFVVCQSDNEPLSAAYTCKKTYRILAFTWHEHICCGHQETVFRNITGSPC